MADKPDTITVPGAPGDVLPEIDDMATPSLGPTLVAVLRPIASLKIAVALMCRGPCKPSRHRANCF